MKHKYSNDDNTDSLEQKLRPTNQVKKQLDLLIILFYPECSCFAGHNPADAPSYSY